MLFCRYRDNLHAMRGTKRWYFGANADGGEVDTPTDHRPRIWYQVQIRRQKVEKRTRKEEGHQSIIVGPNAGGRSGRCNATIVDNATHGEFVYRMPRRKGFVLSPSKHKTIIAIVPI